MPSALDTAVHRLRRRIAFGLWIGSSAKLGAVLAVLGASLVLLARALFGWPLEQAAWFLAPIAAAPFAALFMVRARVPSPAALITWLDLSAGAHGTLVTSTERPDPRWSTSIERELALAPEPPALRLGPPTRRLLAASAFALAALFVPLARPAPGPDGTLFEQLIRGLSEKLATLDEIVELDAETLTELTERIGRLAELAGERLGSESLLESIDAVSERMETIASEVAEAGVSAADLFARAAAEALADPDSARVLFEQGFAMLDAVGLSKDLPAGLAELARHLDGSELKLPAGLELSDETLREWSEAMRDGLRGDLDALSRSGLAVVSERELADMARTLAELLDDEHVCDSACEAAGTCTKAGRAGVGGRPGRGGLTRGRADAELTWGREVDGADERFTANALPPARAADLAHSGTLGLSENAPEVDARGEAAGTNAEVGSQGSASWRRRLSPRHKRAVQEFFTPSSESPR